MSEHTPLPHSPLPWVPFAGPYAGAPPIFDANGRVVLSVHCQEIGDGPFVVRACNSHDDLLAALKDITDSFGRKMDGTLTVDEANALIKARTAIDKAELPA